MCQRSTCSPTILWALVLLVALGLAVAAQTPAASEPLAEVDGEAIAAEEVEKAIAAQLSKLEEQIYNLKRQKVEELIAERLPTREAVSTDPRTLWMCTMKRIIASVGIAVALLLAVAPAGVGLLGHTGIASADLVNNDPPPPGPCPGGPPCDPPPPGPCPGGPPCD